MPYAGHGVSTTKPRGRRRKTDDMPKGRPRKNPYRESKRARELPEITRDRLGHIAEFLQRARVNSGLYLKDIRQRASTLAPGFGMQTLQAYLNREAMTRQGDVSAVRLWAVTEAMGTSMLDLERFLAGETSTLNTHEQTMLQLFRVLPNDADRDELIALARYKIRQHQLAGASPSASTSRPPTQAEVIAEITRQGESEDD